MEFVKMGSQKRREAVDSELRLSRQAYADGLTGAAFGHLERAHVLSQPRTWLHVRTHLAMLVWAWRQNDRRELLGQLIRIPAALVFSRIWVPLGNTGGAKVNARLPMEIPEDLSALLRSFGRD